MKLQGKRIFVIEDNAGTCAMIQLLLEHHGAIVIIGQGWNDIIPTLQNEKVDLIIMDLILWDGITGHNIYDEIRAREQYNTIPIVAISASDPVNALEETLARGFSGFISKPIDYNLFPDQIKQVLNGEEIWYIR